MTLKHYIVEDLSALAAITAWTQVRANRAQLFCETREGYTGYRVIIDDHQGMAACSPAFDAEFGSAVRETAFPE